MKIYQMHKRAHHKAVSFSPMLVDNGVWNAAGLLTHSASAFWNRRTCNGFVAIPTNAIISRNSSSPASHSCCTSSPPSLPDTDRERENLWIIRTRTEFGLRSIYPFQAVCRNRPANWLSVAHGTTGVRLRLTVSMLRPLETRNIKVNEIRSESHALDIYFSIQKRISQSTQCASNEKWSRKGKVNIWWATHLQTAIPSLPFLNSRAIRMPFGL